MAKNDILWVNFIKVIAIFSVIWLHTAAPLLSQYNELSPAGWWIGNIYDSSVRMCVPLFFIISGYLLLGKQETIGIFFIKRVNKVLIPLVTWSIFYIFWKHYYLNSETISLYSFYSLIFSPTFFHLWFLYALIGLYLYTPILRVIVQHASKELLYYFIGLWFIAVSIIPLLEKATHIKNNIVLSMISGYVGYFVIGWLWGDVQVNKSQLKFMLLIALVSEIVTIMGTFFLTIRHNGVFDSYFYSYLSPNVVLLSVSTFILLKHIANSLTLSENQKAILNSLNSASFGIYLIHPMVMSVLSAGLFGFSLNVSATNALYSVPMTTLLTFIISFALILLLQQIPYLRKCVS